MMIFSTTIILQEPLMACLFPISFCELHCTLSVKLLFQMITCSLCRVCRTIFVDFETVVWYDQGKMMALFRSTERLTALPGARSRRRLAVKYRRSRSSSGAAVGILLSFSFCLIFVSCIATIALPVGIGKPSSLSAKGYSRD